ncbi:hypothetical protein AVEN_65420-1 [Araneus ventricosus]|uniref:Uncharacterized protein n=1 Tax=Araneus ventricosus TaxID=182803 RepID=A0A4Y2UPT0_ARAVE|nr:hypothetical protein AVEN_65420-1 [Araneus ventricosus]
MLWGLVRIYEEKVLINASGAYVVLLLRLVGSLPLRLFNALNPVGPNTRLIYRVIGFQTRKNLRLQYATSATVWKENPPPYGTQVSWHYLGPIPFLVFCNKDQLQNQWILVTQDSYTQRYFSPTKSEASIRKRKQVFRRKIEENRNQ